MPTLAWRQSGIILSNYSARTNRSMPGAFRLCRTRDGMTPKGSETRFFDAVSIDSEEGSEDSDAVVDLPGGRRLVASPAAR